MKRIAPCPQTKLNALKPVTDNVKNTKQQLVELPNIRKNKGEIPLIGMVLEQDLSF